MITVVFTKTLISNVALCVNIRLRLISHPVRFHHLSDSDRLEK